MRSSFEKLHYTRDECLIAEDGETWALEEEMLSRNSETKEKIKFSS